MRGTMAEAGLHSVVDTSAPDRRRERRRLTSIQFMLAMALTIGLILALNFSSRINLDRALGRIHRQFADEIGTLLEERERLVAELEYVKSDAYVEFWARDEGKMVRDGEVLILPQRIEEEAARPRSTVRLVDFETTVPEPENWELWWALFFDGPPPNLN